MTLIGPLSVPGAERIFLILQAKSALSILLPVKSVDLGKSQAGKSFVYINFSNMEDNSRSPKESHANNNSKKSEERWDMSRMTCDNVPFKSVENVSAESPSQEDGEKQVSSEKIFEGHDKKLHYQIDLVPTQNDGSSGSCAVDSESTLQQFQEQMSGQMLPIHAGTDGSDDQPSLAPEPQALGGAENVHEDGRDPETRSDNAMASSSEAAFEEGVITIQSMGFDIGDAQAAMIQTNNDIHLAVELLTDGQIGDSALQTETQQVQEEEEDAVLVTREDASLEQTYHSPVTNDAKQLHAGVSILAESFRSNFDAITKKIDDKLTSAEKLLDQKLKETSSVSSRFSSFTSGARSWGGLISQKVSVAACKSKDFIKEVTKDLELEPQATPPLHRAVFALGTGKGLAPVALAFDANRYWISTFFL
jgi:hypothetical protein